MWTATTTARVPTTACASTAARRSGPKTSTSCSPCAASPCLYYGSEIEFRAGSPIDVGTNDALKNTGRAYYGGYIKGNVSPTGFGTYSAADGNVAATLNHPLARHIARLSQIRQAVPALRKGQWSKSGCSATNGYAFKRRYTEGNVDSYVCVSINSGATFTGVENGTYTDCISGDVQVVSNGTLTTRTFSSKGNMCVYVLNGPGQIGEDGPYLYTTGASASSDTAYDGTEEESSTVNGGSDEATDVPLDDLEVYTPCSNSDETAVFYEAASSVAAVSIWVWNANANFTGGSWDGKPAMKLMGKTADGTRKIFKWTYEGSETSEPTGLIFVPSGQSQTADLSFVNHGYYVDGTYSYTAGACNDYATVAADKDSGTYYETISVLLFASEADATIVYTLDGTTPTAASAQATGEVSLTISETTTVKAGVLVDGEVYNIKTFTYTIKEGDGTITIYVSADSAPYLYAWNSTSTTLAGAWPGTKLTNTVEQNGTTWYYMTFDAETLNIIFNNGNGSQTADITGITEDSYFTYDGSTGYTFLYTGIEEPVNRQLSTVNCEIYTLDGRRIDASAMKQGIYIIRQGNTSRKIVR